MSSVVSEFYTEVLFVLFVIFMLHCWMIFVKLCIFHKLWIWSTFLWVSWKVSDCRRFCGHMKLGNTALFSSFYVYCRYRWILFFSLVCHLDEISNPCFGSYICVLCCVPLFFIYFYLSFILFYLFLYFIYLFIYFWQLILDTVEFDLNVRQGIMNKWK